MIFGTNSQILFKLVIRTGSHIDLKKQLDTD
jgi:hypothetical protein